MEYVKLPEEAIDAGHAMADMLMAIKILQTSGGDLELDKLPEDLRPLVAAVLADEICPHEAVWHAVNYALMRGAH